MTDQQIITLYWERDERAIRETDDRYGAYCRTIAQNILHDPQDAEESANDTWFRAWNAIPPARPRQLKWFLAKITRNLALDRFKAQNAEKRKSGETALILDELEECLPAQNDTQQQIEAHELQGCINRFVHNLPAREGNVFIRRYFFAESIPEIAKKYRLSQNHISVILSRTRKRLKDHLEKEGYFV